MRLRRLAIRCLCLGRSSCLPLDRIELLVKAVEGAHGDQVILGRTRLIALWATPFAVHQADWFVLLFKQCVYRRNLLSELVSDALRTSQEARLQLTSLIRVYEAQCTDGLTALIMELDDDADADAIFLDLDEWLAGSGDAKIVLTRLRSKLVFCVGGDRVVLFLVWLRDVENNIKHAGVTCNSSVHKLLSVDRFIRRGCCEKRNGGE